MHARNLISLSLLACLALPFSAEAHTLTATPSSQAAEKPLRFVTAATGGARLRTFADPTEKVVLEVPEGEILAVHQEHGKFLKVCAPGGVRAWVYGSLLAKTSDPNVMRVTGSNVNLRPLPGSGPNSYPVGQVRRDALLTVIKRADDKLPLAEDWVLVHSPNTVQAWVSEIEVRPLAAVEDGPKLWRRASDIALAAQRSAAPSVATQAPPTGGPATADRTTPVTTNSPTTPVAGTDLVRIFEEARQDFEDARLTGSKDYESAKQGFQTVLSMAAGGSLAGEAQVALDQVRAQEDLDALRAQIASEQTRRTEKVTTLRTEYEARQAARKDPLAGRLQARGWLEREVVEGQDKVRYWVVWGGRVRAELMCSSGRYNLDLFENFEVGITGATLREAMAPAPGEPGLPALVDVTRIEVIQGRVTVR